MFSTDNPPAVGSTVRGIRSGLIYTVVSPPFVNPKNDNNVVAITGDSIEEVSCVSLTSITVVDTPTTREHTYKVRTTASQRDLTNALHDWDIVAEVETSV